jgi:hypothetical protein
MITTDIGRGHALLTIPLAYAADSLTLVQLYVVGFLVGVMTVFFELAATSYLPSLVGREGLMDANSSWRSAAPASSLPGRGSPARSSAPSKLPSQSSSTRSAS